MKETRDRRALSSRAYWLILPAASHERCDLGPGEQLVSLATFYRW